jgi:hypothetical protein
MRTLTTARLLAGAFILTCALSPPLAAQFVPNDPFYGAPHGANGDGQWHLPHINMPLAWEIASGDPSIVVAVIDGGLEITHPEISGNLWTNPNEIPINGADDDNNGCEDDIHGCNFNFLGGPRGRDGDIDGSDHGTSTSGLIAARSGNGAGVASPAGGMGAPGVRIMTLVYDANSSGAGARQQVADAIRYAVDEGASVINMSLKFTVDDPVLEAAVVYAAQNDVLMVAARGNAPKEPDVMAYPAHYAVDYDEVLSVAATDDQGVYWSGNTQTSTATSLFAPGGVNKMLTLASFLSSEDEPADGYTEMYGGTSASTPLVSAVAALIRSMNPSLSAATVAQILTSTADPNGCQMPGGGACVAGRLDAYAALVYTLENFGGTLTQDVTVPAGETWDLGGVTLAFAPGKRLYVEGTLNADGTSFTATDAAQGWGGIRFETGSTGDLANFARIEDVTGGPNGYAVLVHNADLTLDATEIDGFGGDGGIYAAGSNADVAISGASLITEGDTYGRGLFAFGGASILVASDGPTISLHDYAGLHASGIGSTITVNGGTVEFNEGVGALATSGGTVDLLRTGGDIVISENEGGLRGETGASFSTTGENSFVDNGDIGDDHDAYAFEFTLLDAKNTWWGEINRSNIHTFEDPGSSLDIDPILTGPPSSSLRSSGSEGSTSAKSGDAALGPEDATHALIVEAERLRREGDGDAAAVLLTGALSTAASERDRGLLASAAVRLLADPRVETSGTALRAWAATSASTPGPNRAWARRMLVAAQMTSGDRAGARNAAEALLGSGPRHAAFGRRLLVRLAVEEGDVQAAVGHLSALSALDAEEAAEVALGIQAAFPDAPVPSGATTAAGLPAASATTAPGPETLALTVHPNPASQTAEIVLTVPETADDVDLAVYDALGRRVADLRAEGTATTRYAHLDVRDFPVGVYLARMTAGERSAMTIRFTVVR